MNHNTPIGSGESWPASGGSEDSAPKNKRKNRRSNRHKSRQDTVRQIPKKAENRPNGPREYSAKKLSEAVIWVRDSEHLDKGTKPLIQPRKLTPDNNPVEQVQTIEHNDGENEHAWVDEFAAAPYAEQRDAPETAPGREREQAAYDHQRADHEPPRVPERRFFWNQSDVYSPNTRDTLPAVSGKQKPEHEEKPVDKVPSPSGQAKPMLEKAINPNLNIADASGSRPEGMTDSEKKSGKSKPKSGFLSRRRDKRAVQSHEMEGETFEQVEADPFPESQLYSEAEFTQPEIEPFVAPEQPTEEAVAAGTPPEAIQAETRKTSGLKPVQSERAPSEQFEPAAANFEKAFESSPELPRDTVEHALKRSELLDLARSIRVDGVSVYEMFTAKRIDEEGLRKIIVAYLRGENLRQLIAGEVIRQQMKFERDPQLRDTPVNTAKANKPDKPGRTKRAASKIKNKTKSLLDSDRTKDRTERMAEFTQELLEKSHEFMHENPNAGRTLSIAAIVVIYVTILVVALAK
jgi:ElaB/YqjD/DUF883 family membrane-anchored ribosome-binding protein